MQELVIASPALKSHLIRSKHGRETINFSNADAVKALNKALLIQQYDLKYWDIPAGHLCPPIPGRVDYILALKDVLEVKKVAEGVNESVVNMLDIGTGANLIYPLLAQSLFGWHCVGSDIDSGSISNAQTIIDHNPSLEKRLKLRLQPESSHIFKHIILENEYFDVTCCNPPFHKSAEEAMAGSIRKNKNLVKNKLKRDSKIKYKDKVDDLNFSGQSNELWCEGGELAFIKKMIKESKYVADQVGLFSCLVSKKDNLAKIASYLKSIKVSHMNIHEMQQGNKISRFITWTFKK